MTPERTGPGDDDLDPTQVVTGGASLPDDELTQVKEVKELKEDSDEATRVLPGTDPAATVASPHRHDAVHTSDAALLPVGSRIAEFEVTRVIGQGGFGVVYEAWDTDLERVVALKEYLPLSLSVRQSDGTVVAQSERSKDTFDLGMRSFINEARLLAQFDHPSLLKVWRFWQERGTAYMAMPFYRGDTLRQSLATMTGGVDEGWLLNIVDGVTQALAVMHNANCYHRDIAPDNIILLADSGRPVLLDFGAARRVITDKTQAITVILKPGYAPVEQYAEMPDMAQGAWTDVYALAAVMHVAVTGRAPPPSVARLLSDTYAPVSGNETLRTRYGAQLLAAIDAGLGVRPESRPQSMAELRVALGFDDASTVIVRKPRAAAGSGDEQTLIQPQATGIVPPKKPTEPSGSNRRKLVAVAAAVLVAAGGGWWWMQQQGEPKPTPADTVATDAKPPVAAAPPVEATASAQGATETPPVPQKEQVAPRPVTPAESLQSLANGATPGFAVTATARKAEVTIGKDKLGFEVRSNREGYVYVFLLSTGNEMFLLFPNLLDKYNKIAANTPLALPRASWPMDSGGPPGTNQFAVLVSEHERDFTQSGIQSEGVFPRFPLPELAALEASRGTGPAPLLGKAVCPPNAPCKDVYGVGNFRIVEK